MIQDPRLFASHIEANFKGALAHALSRRTLITGPNASQKTAIISALITALTGRDDARGKSPSRLLKHAPGKEKRLFANVIIDAVTGQSANKTQTTSMAAADLSWFIDKKGKGATQPEPKLVWRAHAQATEHVDYDHLTAVLSRDVKALLASEEKRRQALLRIVSPPGMIDAVAGHLHDAHRQAWDECRRFASGGAADADSAGDADADPTRTHAEADILIAAKKYATKRQREEKKIADADPGGSPPPAPSPEEAAALRQTLAECQNAAYRIRQMDAAERRAVELRAAVAQLTQQIAQAHAAVTQTQAAQGLPTVEAIAAIETVLVAQRHVLELNPDGTGYCMGCRRDVPADRVRIAMHAAETDAAHAARARQVLTSAQQAMGAAQSVVDLQRRLHGVQQELDDMGRIIDGAKRAGAVVTPAEMQAAEQAVSAAEAQLRDKDAWAEATRKATAAREHVTAYKAVQDAIVKVQTEALDGAIDGFCSVGSEVLPKSEKLCIRLFDQGDEVCEIGLRHGRDEMRDWDGLSGRERAQCVAALCCAWAGSRPERLTLVCIDEVDFDRASLKALCESFTAVMDAGRGPSQVVVGKAEAGIAPEGWTVIETRAGVEGQDLGA